MTRCGLRMEEEIMAADGIVQTLREVVYGIMNEWRVWLCGGS